jgi:hypothetical protein
LPRLPRCARRLPSVAQRAGTAPSAGQMGSDHWASVPDRSELICWRGRIDRASAGGVSAHDRTEFEACAPNTPQSLPSVCHRVLLGEGCLEFLSSDCSGCSLFSSSRVSALVTPAADDSGVQRNSSRSRAASTRIRWHERCHLRAVRLRMESLDKYSQPARSGQSVIGAR